MNITVFQGQSYSSVVERLSAIHETLASILSTTQQQNKAPTMRVSVNGQGGRT